MKRVSFLLALICVASSIAGSPQDPPKRKIQCKTAENAKTCYWTRGRLSLYNGTPSLRLWKIGTHRLLGIYSGPGAGPFDDGVADDQEGVELPATLMKHDFTKSSVFGEFEVCPLAPEKEGRMQPSCIECVKGIVVGKAQSDF